MLGSAESEQHPDPGLISHEVIFEEF